MPPTVANVLLKFVGGTVDVALDATLLSAIRTSVAAEGGVTSGRVRITHLCEETTGWCKTLDARRERRLQAAPGLLPLGQLYRWTYKIVVDLTPRAGEPTVGLPSTSEFASTLNSALVPRVVNSNTFAAVIQAFSSSSGIPAADVIAALSSSSVVIANVGSAAVDPKDRFGKWYGLAVGLACLFAFLIIGGVVWSRRTTAAAAGHVGSADKAPAASV